MTGKKDMNHTGRCLHILNDQKKSGHQRMDSTGEARQAPFSTSEKVLLHCSWVDKKRITLLARCYRTISVKVQRDLSGGEKQEDLEDSLLAPIFEQANGHGVNRRVRDAEKERTEVRF